MTCQATLTAVKSLGETPTVVRSLGGMSGRAQIHLSKIRKDLCEDQTS